MSPNVRRCLSAAAAAAFASTLVGPARAEPPLRASGTGTALAAMRRISEAYAKASPGDRLEVLPSIGTSGAVRAVASGALQVGLIGRPLEPAEKALGLVGLPYAKTPFVFVVGPRSGVNGVTEEETVRIYRGATSAWPTGERVRVVLRPKADADTQLLRAISPALASAIDAAFAREGMLMAATNQECDAMVAKTPGAFGPTSLSQVVAEGEPLRPLAWNGVAPTAANLASGAYPLGKTLEIVVRASPPPGVRRLLAFLRTDEARKILVETGNLPLAFPASE